MSLLDAHPFKCSKCKKRTAHRLIQIYDTRDVENAPEEVWLVECQNCFESRIIYPSERIASAEDDIERCSGCGNYKMKSVKCRICRIMSGQEQLKESYFNGHTTVEREIPLT